MRPWPGKARPKPGLLSPARARTSLPPTARTVHDSLEEVSRRPVDRPAREQALPGGVSRERGDVCEELLCAVRPCLVHACVSLLRREQQQAGRCDRRRGRVGGVRLGRQRRVEIPV